MIRVALYARYSSDQQREASVEGQLRLCGIVGFSNSAVSCTSLVVRPPR